MRAIKSYQRTNIESAPNEELIVMLVEAALRREVAADAAMARGDRTGWLTEIHGARSVFVELLVALDPTAQPEIAKALSDTYRWILHHLTEAGRTGDRVRLDEVRAVTDTVRTMWTNAVRIHRGDVDPLDATPLEADAFEDDELLEAV
ncbi:MAG: flagellar export chaperone FliS [Pseudomonadota bacterium]|nr:flagellar export chaperone FliS [Pseudomonadota bacterium]